MQPAMPGNDLLTTDEATDILKISIRKIREMIESGKLPAILSGPAIRIRRRDVEKLVDERIAKK